MNLESPPSASGDIKWVRASSGSSRRRLMPVVSSSPGSLYDEAADSERGAVDV